MELVNVILPDGDSFFQADATPTEAGTTDVVKTVEHQTVHETDELEVANVFDAVHDEAFDAADTTTADPNARVQQNLNILPQLVNGMSFRKLSHTADTDPTTDSSSISMYRTIYIEPPPNKPAGFPPPTLYSSGTVCVVGDGHYAYVPYGADGHPKANTRYIFGRAEELGDRSHDNDGLMMLMEHRETGGYITNNLVHMSPNPTDPFLVVKTDRDHNEANLIEIHNRGTEIDSYPVFTLDRLGIIKSDQIESLEQRVASLTERLNTLLDSLDALKDHVDGIGREVNVSPLPADEWNLPYNTG